MIEFYIPKSKESKSVRGMKELLEQWYLSYHNIDCLPSYCLEDECFRSIITAACERTYNKRPKTDPTIGQWASIVFWLEDRQDIEIDYESTLISFADEEEDQDEITD